MPPIMPETLLPYLEFLAITAASVPVDQLYYPAASVIIHSSNSTLSFMYSMNPSNGQSKTAVMCHSKLWVSSTQNSMKTDSCNNF